MEEEQRKAVEERIAAASSGKVLEDLTFDKMQQIRSFYTQVRAQPHRRPACATTDFPFAKSPPPPPPFWKHTHPPDAQASRSVSDGLSLTAQLRFYRFSIASL